MRKNTIPYLLLLVSLASSTLFGFGSGPASPVAPPQAAAAIAAPVAPAAQPQTCSGTLGWTTYSNTVATATNLYAVAASDPSNVWAVGSYNPGSLTALAMRWNGTAWAQMIYTPPLSATNSVFYSVAATVTQTWAVGSYSDSAGKSHSLIARYDGTSWTNYNAPDPGNVTNSLNAVVATNNEAYAVGSFTTLSQPGERNLAMHFDSFSGGWLNDGANTIGTRTNRLNAVALGSQPWSGGYAYNTLTSTLPTYATSATVTTFTFAGLLSTWNEMRGAAAVGLNTSVLVGYGYNSTPNLREPLVITRTGGGVYTRATLPPGSYALNDVDYASGHNLWAVGAANNNGLTTTVAITSSGFGSGNWTAINTPNLGNEANYLNGVKVLSSEDVWAVGTYVNSGTPKAMMAHYKCISGASFSGQIREFTSNNPLPLAEVRINDGNGNLVTSDNAGNYNFGGVPVGSFKITVAKPGYYTQTLTLAFVDNQRLALDFTLVPIGLDTPTSTATLGTPPPSATSTSTATDTPPPTDTPSPSSTSTNTFTPPPTTSFTPSSTSTNTSPAPAGGTATSTQTATATAAASATPSNLPTPRPHRWRPAPVLTTGINVLDFDFVPSNPNDSSDLADSVSGWAVASNGLSGSQQRSALLQRNSGVWQVFSTTAQYDLAAVDLISPTLGYAVGGGGSILVYDGRSWGVVDSPVNSNLNRIGRNPITNKVYAVGDGGTLIRKNNPLNPAEPWVQIPLTTSYDMKDLSFSDDGTGFCVGRNGMMLRFNGSTWTNYTLPYNDDLTGVSLAEPNRGFAVSQQGHIFGWDGSSWSVVYSDSNFIATSIVTERKGQWVDGVSAIAVGHDGNGRGRIISERKGQWVDEAGSYPQLNKVTIAPDGHSWAVGDNATIITYDSCDEFSDVPENNIFYAYIHPLTCIGAVNGFGPNFYNVAAQASRGQFAKMAAISFAVPNFTPTSPTFADVPAAYVFYSYIEAAAHSGLINGYSPAQCGTAGSCFRPNSPINRAEIALIVRRARNWPLATPTVPTFGDVPPTYFAYGSIEALAQRGVISGGSCAGGRGICFRPNNNVRRDELSKFLWLGLSAP